MKFRPKAVFGLGLLAAAAVSSVPVNALAQSNGQGDAKRGEVLAYTCYGCHGVPNYKNAFPNYSVPHIGGQNAQYLVNALKAYASGERSHPTMHSQAATLSDQDRADIAAYLQGPQPVQPNKQTVGTPPAATQVCASCHGADGAKVIAPDYPILAGQYPDYIVEALKDYKSGKRKNPIMAGIIGTVDEKDFKAIAQFFGKQPGLCGLEQIREHGKCSPRSGE
jgi:cytochrome c553